MLALARSCRVALSGCYATPVVLPTLPSSLSRAISSLTAMKVALYMSARSLAACDVRGEIIGAAASVY